MLEALVATTLALATSLGGLNTEGLEYQLMLLQQERQRSARRTSVSKACQLQRVSCQEV